MTLLIVGLAAFFGAHLIPSLGGVRDGVVARLSLNGYKLAFTLLAGVGLVLIILGYQRAAFTPVYTPLDPATARSLAHTVMPLAFILLAGANMRSNLKRYVAHPMSLGVLLWAGVHLANRGDVASILLFGAFALYALFNIVTGKRGPTPPVQPRIKDLILIVAALVAYGAAIFLHGYFGVRVVGDGLV